MNIKEYIESGILEAYVLGALGETERAEVEANIAKYPELADEVMAIEDSLILLAEASAIAPPAEMQSQIWAAIQPQAAPAIPTPKPAPQAPKTIEFTGAPKNNSWQRAAVWVALIGSVLLNFMLWSQRSNADKERQVLMAQMDTVKQQQQQLAGLISSYRNEMEMMADTSVQTIVMKSLKPGHPMAATVYWNKNNGEAYLAMKKLPMPPQGMQYQMWVIQDGKPVSMGVLPNEMADNNTMALLPMNVTNGQAFAISLEKEGGSAVPTAENIYVLGGTT